MNIRTNTKFIWWWVSTLIVATGLFWSGYLGLLSFIWQIDITYITSIIGVQYLIAMAMLGYMAFKSAMPEFHGSNLHKKLTDHCWFFSESLMALGMLGTVIGLIHMSFAFATVNMAETTALQVAVLESYHALGLALFTNMVGLVASIALKYQTQFIGYSDEE